MLNFRNTSIALFIFAVLVLILLFFNIRPGMFPVLAVIAWLILLIIGSVNIRSDFYIKAFCKGKTVDKVILLTFDDGPDPVITPEVLKILKTHQVPAAFFVIGSKAEKEVQLMTQIIKEGHTVGIHSYSHAFFFDLYRRKKMEQDLQKAEEVIMSITGKRPLLFRPPYGVTNPVLAGVVKKLDYKVIGWSVRSFDTVHKDAERVAGRVIGKLHPGAVILMHDTREITPEAVEIIIRKAKEEGYRFAGIEELI
jgi:peptidoglycan/xylan/chitin deacetylase (PgdA/CDA1 family)